MSSRQSKLKLSQDISLSLADKVKAEINKWTVLSVTKEGHRETGVSHLADWSAKL